jgi:integrase
MRVKTTEAKDSTKTVNSFRTLALFPTAKHCLEQVKALQNEYKKFFGDSYLNTDGYVFTWEDGRTYDPDYISKLFGKATKAFGRPEITLHKLRHTCASLLINKGWDVKKLQYWLGHSDTSTTLNIYSHFDWNRLNEIPDDLEILSESCAGLFQ